ncbi:MAG: thermosome subunit alpha [Candidatus Helarchaeota archaeon]
MEFVPQGKPFLVMKRKTDRMVGNEAQRFNILTVCVLSELIRTTLGPFGYEKLIIDPVNEMIISNNGGTIMKNFEVRHPAAKMLDKLVRHMEDEIGDTTKTAMIYAGELLKKAQIKLMDEKVHQNLIIEGYQKAIDKAMDILEKLAIDCSEIDEGILKKIIRTSLNQRFNEKLTSKIEKIIIQAINYIKEESDGQIKVNLKDNIHILGIIGKGNEDIELIQGMAIELKSDEPGEITKVNDARIACIEPSIEPRKFKFADSKKQSIKVNSLSEHEKINKEQINYLKSKLQIILDAGANVLFTRRDLHYKVIPYLKKAGVLAAKWVKGWELEKIAKACGARLIKNLDYMSANVLGKAELVEKTIIGNKNVIMVKGCKNPKAITILIRGSNEHVVEETERRINNALHDVKNLLEEKKIIAGGGAIEMELSKEILTYSRKFTGKEQLAIETYAKCMEIIPFTLAESSGLNPRDAMTKLKSIHVKDEGKHYGVNLEDVEPVDMLLEGIIEPLKNKKEALQAATELACMILKIDDIIYATPAEHELTIEEEEAWDEYVKNQ